MVRSGAFQLEVLVAGVPLAEHAAPSGDTYVETRFDAPTTYQQQVTECDPFGETFLQRWPVTPYELRVTNRSDDTVQVVVHIDGAKASRQYVDPGVAGVIRGFKDRSSSNAAFREFLFTLPRRVPRGEEDMKLNAAQRALLVDKLESIRVEVYRATRTHDEFKMRSSDAVRTGLEAVNKAVAHGGGAAATSAAGRTHGVRPPKMRKVKHYAIGPLLATLQVRYTQRHKLENLGLVAPAQAAVPRSAAGAAGAAGGAVKREGGGGAEGAERAAPRRRNAAPQVEYVDLL